MPDDQKGATLIAGHVDSASAGAGAFHRLRSAKKGDRVRVKVANGRTITYRVVSVKTMPKKALPPDIYSLKGRHRLVLVTCGGPFNARIGHYRDNVVVTAVRA
jgi:LPXTG-site transpeptidase (sortase) family protein